jgi:hypothetical protein
LINIRNRLPLSFSNSLSRSAYKSMSS